MWDMSEEREADGSGTPQAVTYFFYSNGKRVFMLKNLYVIL